MTKQSTKDFFKEYGANKMNPEQVTKVQITLGMKGNSL